MGSGASFAELQATTNFSFLRGASHPAEFIARAAELGYSAIAITDHHTLAGVVRAHAAAKKTGMKLLLGCRVRFGDLPFSLLLHATDKESYSRMSSLLTVGKLRAKKGECSLTLDDLPAHAKGLLGTIVPEGPGLDWDPAPLKEIFDADRLSLALTSTYAGREEKLRAAVIALGKKLDIPLLATNDVHYHSPARRMLQDTLTCIRLGCTIEEAGFALHQNAERYLKSLPEIAHLFRHFPAALRRSVELAERCNFSLDELRYEYPQEICPEEKTPKEYLRELVIEGCKRHYPRGLPKTVAGQIKHELELITDLKYEKYFLTVYDIVRFARSRGILCQGRGAAANSAVCFVLGITAVDPAQVRLLFERFVSKERNEPPDIDIDFEHERREEVIQYIYAKFGRLRAAITAEAICYRTRSSIRDVGKVFGLGSEEIEELIKIRTRGRDENDGALSPSARRTLELAATLRSFPRHLSQHVGGFIISNPPLCEIVPIENAAMADRSTIEWDKDDIEELSMLKIDVLGLGMLTCIRKGLAMVNASRSEEEPFELYNIPREDPAVYDMICRADTIGVFQIESRAQMTMLPRLRPRCFYDLVIEVAIVRPGPIQGGMVHPFLRRRQGLEPVVYPDERVEEILRQTLGVPIFQEQIMELAVVAAGFTPGESDELRRAMGRWNKSSNELLQFEHRVKDGMKKNGYPDDFAHQVFEQMKGFGEYGFPQSHAASFAHLVYVSAWLKCHYPAHFAAALINSLPMGFYQPAQIVQDAKNHGVTIRDIDVNSSSWDCTLEGPRTIRLGMRMIKGLREAEANKIASAVKERGPFRSLLELWRASGARLDQFRILARADAFRSLGLDRQQALWVLKKFRDDSMPLFDGREDREEPVSLPALAEYLHVLRDYSMTGLSLKAHPMSFIRPLLDKHRVLTAAEFRAAQNGKRLAFVGLVLLRQRPNTASGTLFMTLEDETGMVNLIVWPAVFEKYTDDILDGTFLVVSGRMQREGEVLHLIAEEVLDISGYSPDLEAQSRDFR